MFNAFSEDKCYSKTTFVVSSEYIVLLRTIKLLKADASILPKGKLDIVYIFQSAEIIVKEKQKE